MLNRRAVAYIMAVYEYFAPPFIFSPRSLAQNVEL